jgi:hypothetical protein
VTNWRTLMISAATIATSSIGGQAGPCYDEIYRVEARLKSLLQAKSAAGPSAPTRESIAAAVTRLWLASPQAADADRAGDLDACERALADVESAIAQAPKQ